jgi:hypothetical protein
MSRPPVGSPSLGELFHQLEVKDLLAFVAEQRREDLTLDFKVGSVELRRSR